MTAVSMSGSTSMGFSHNNHLSRGLSSLRALFVDGERRLPQGARPRHIARAEREREGYAVAVDEAPKAVPIELKPLGLPSARRRVSYGAVRDLVSRSHDVLQAHELPTGEACAAAETLGWKPRFLKGDKLAVGLRRASTGEIAAVAICAKPTADKFDDALTLELRCFKVDVENATMERKLLVALGRFASARGFRRLVVEGPVCRPESPAMADWDRVASVCRVGCRNALWASVLRGDGRPG